MLTVEPSAAESALPDEDEFLPRVDPSCNQLLLEELDDEEANSALCKYFFSIAAGNPCESVSSIHLTDGLDRTYACLCLSSV